MSIVARLRGNLLRTQAGILGISVHQPQMAALIRLIRYY